MRVLLGHLSAVVVPGQREPSGRGECPCRGEEGERSGCVHYDEMEKRPALWMIPAQQWILGERSRRRKTEESVTRTWTQREVLGAKTRERKAEA